MIVDDSYFNIEIMKDVMQQVLKIDVDRDVVEANNGKEAVIKYIELHKEFQVCPIQIILMDCDMPVMNGFRATEFILKFANE
jgi:CheY-like chemotaxis protein